MEEKAKRTPWNKGLKGKQRAWNKGIKMTGYNYSNVGKSEGSKRTYFKKGHNFSNHPNSVKNRFTKDFKYRHNFPKGHTPWNKGFAHLIPEKHPNWRGGITEIRLRIRGIHEYKSWKQICLNRDNFTCRICNKRGGNLAVDHYPKMFAEILNEFNINKIEEARECSELWNLDNGRTLCEPCHRKTDTYAKRV